MDLKQKTKEQLETRVKDLEDFIARKGIGSSYLSKVEKAQRNVNLLLVAGITTTVIGLAVWLSSGKSED